MDVAMDGKPKEAKSELDVAKDGKPKETKSGLHLSALNLIENHYVRLPSQGNIFTLAALPRVKGNCKVMVASLNKKLFSIEFNKNEYEIFENHLSFMPSEGDVVAIKAYRSECDQFSIGLTFLTKDSTCDESMLYIFSNCHVEGGLEFTDDLSRLSSIPLLFMPYALFFTLLPAPLEREVVWFVSGSDYRIHMFKTSNETNEYEEVASLEDTFPEFDRIDTITLDLDILYLEERKSRMTVTCGEGGLVHVFKVDVVNPEGPTVMASRVVQFDFPCSSVKLFYGRKKMSDVINLDFDGENDENDEEYEDCDKPFFAVATTLESCFVFRADNMTSVGTPLPDSDKHDVVTCCIVCDINFDGRNEVIFGTYGQAVLIYKQTKNSSGWILMKKLNVPSPVLALAYEDVLGDGPKELVVSTMTGVHIFQTDPEDVAKLVIERLRRIQM